MQEKKYRLGERGETGLRGRHLGESKDRLRFFSYHALLFSRYLAKKVYKGEKQEKKRKTGKEKVISNLYYKKEVQR